VLDVQALREFTESAAGRHRLLVQGVCLPAARGRAWVYRLDGPGNALDSTTVEL